MYRFINGCLFLFVLITSCKKEDKIEHSTPNDDQSTNVVIPDIYCGGLAGSDGFVYKNGVDDNWDSLRNGIIKKIRIFNGDIYAVGTSTQNLSSTLTPVATLWKNKQLIWFDSSQYSAAVDIYFSGTDIYISGNTGYMGGSRAVYWKNGERFSLNGNESESRANGIIILNGKLIISGYENNGNNQAVVWINGEKVNLQTTQNESYAGGLTFIGNDFYIVGYELVNEHYHARYWKNLELNTLTNALNAQANCIVAANNTLYIGGHIAHDGRQRPVVWSNNQQIHQQGSYITNTSSVVDLLVKDNDVYAVGREGPIPTEHHYIKVWKNGNLLNEINAFNYLSIETFAIK